VNTWVNGRGCQRACTYLSNAAVAERPVSSRSGRPGRTAVRLAVSALTSRIAVYVTRMYGGVGGALSDGCPYPHSTVYLSIKSEYPDTSASNFSKRTSRELVNKSLSCSGRKEYLRLLYTYSFTVL